MGISDHKKLRQLNKTDEIKYAQTQVLFPSTTASIQFGKYNPFWKKYF